MSFSRGIVNIVTLGAAAKVDVAAESYKRAVSKYEEYRNLGTEVKQLKQELSQLKKDLKKKDVLINRIYTNPKTRSRLSSIEIKALQEYKNCTDNLSSTPEVSANALGYNDWEDSATENISIIMATTLMPIVGIKAAHASADDKVAEIQSREKEVLEAIRKIQPQAIKMVKIKTQYELAIKTLSTVESVVERYSNE